MGHSRKVGHLRKVDHLRTVGHIRKVGHLRKVSPYTERLVERQPRVDVQFERVAQRVDDARVGVAQPVELDEAPAIFGASEKLECAV
eukprot:2408370-Prymnesium_polylepis.1